MGEGKMTPLRWLTTGLLLSTIISATPTNPRHKREATGCTQATLEALSSPPPSHLEAPKFELVDAKLKLRCANFNLLSSDAPGFVSGGYVEVACVDDSWVGPSEWPVASHCEMANGVANCTVALIDDLPAHLGIQDPAADVTVVASGQAVTLDCTAADKVLSATLAPLTRFCYNGAFEESSAGAVYPEQAECVTPAVCPMALLADVPGHLEANVPADSDVAHETDVTYVCVDGKKLDAAVDLEDTDQIVVSCYNGEFVGVPGTWPSEAQCRAECSSISVPAESNFSPPPDPVVVHEGDSLNLTCQDEAHHVDTDWAGTTYQLVCQSNGTFPVPGTWPKCGVRPKCGVPPSAPSYSGLQPIEPDVLVEASMSAAYRCTYTNQVTDEGDIIEVPCKPTEPDGTPSYDFPMNWGGGTIQCRNRRSCGRVPEVPEFSGLKAEDRPPEGYWEWSKVTYTCSDPNHVMYHGPVRRSSETFEVTCMPPGSFESDINWPICDVLDPPKCTNFLEVPADVPVEIVERTPVLPGNSVYYKCTDPDMVTNLGASVQVQCIKNYLDDTVSFKQPAGWTRLKCRSARYPDFREPACICLGDPGLTPDQSRAIPDQVCRQHARQGKSESRAIPFKERCGVTDPNDITVENQCTCYEKNDQGVDFAIWSLGEIVTHKWHNNLSEPSTSEYQAFQAELQLELDKLFLTKHPSPNAWRFVRTIPFTFLPGKPLGCSVQVIPEPPKESGLKLVEEKPVKFGEYIEYACTNTSLITNDGVRFRIPCLTNGHFQKRAWLTCRSPQVCFRPPPRPPLYSGLGYSQSRDVSEGDNAVYECKQEGHVVPATEDGRFRTPCKRNGNFDQSVHIQWPTCIPKPTAVCEPVPETPAGYMSLLPPQQYLPVGHKIFYICEDSELLAGDGPVVAYQCNQNEDGTYAFKDFDPNSMPECRERLSCSPEDLPMPSLESGLENIVQTQDIEEGKFVEYPCKDGWSLYGDYITPGEFDGINVEISEGKLRLYCGARGALGSLNTWPKCRDTSLTHCSNFTDLSAFGLVASTTEPVQITQSYTISCAQTGQITDNFKSARVVCNYEGNFELPDNLSNCRDANACPSAPEAPTDSHMVKQDQPSLVEFEKQVYVCEDGFTLDGQNHDLITVSGTLELTCILNENNEFAAPSSWPACQEKATSCDSIPYLVGFASADTAPIEIGGTIAFRCTNPNEVTDFGPTLILTCTESGNFAMEYPYMPTCREPAPCGSLPAPSSSSRLLESASVDVTEFGFAEYRCRNGTALPASASDENGNFNVQCEFEGNFPSTIAWPTCIITHCMTVESIPGFVTTSVGPIPVGSSVLYECAITGQIAGDSREPVSVACGVDGNFVHPVPWPQCRSRVDCQTALPLPSSASSLLPSQSSSLKEFDYALYHCKDGANLDRVVSDDVIDGKFRVQCQLHGSWENEANINWPNCTFEQCVNVPAITGFQAMSSPPVDVLANAVYKCSTLGYVMDAGQTMNLVCGQDGVIAKPEADALPECRQAKICTDPLPVPSADSCLLNSTSANVKEFELATYSCKAGASLDGVVHAGIDGGVFHVECMADGSGGAAFPTVTSWPQCIVEYCVNYPTIAGLAPTGDGSPVPVGMQATYICSNPDEIMNFGPSLNLICESDGDFSQPTEANLTCRPAQSCGALPIPPADKRLLNSTSGEVREFQFAVYNCQPGSSFTGVSDPGIIDGSLHVECNNQASFVEPSPWPACIVENCLALPEMTALKTDALAPVPVFANVTYVCNTTGLIMDAGESISVQCLGDGNFDVPQPVPPCRAPATCTAPPPVPPSATGLEYDVSSIIDEFDYVEYSCEVGTSLVGQFGSGIWQDKFHVQCRAGAYADTGSIGWPNCKRFKCDTLPTELSPDYVTQTAMPVYVGGVASYRCAANNEVMPTGDTMEVECLDTGLFDLPDPLPTCAAPADCVNPPEPPTANNIKPYDTAIPVVAFDEAVFECQDDFFIDGGSVATFSIQCQQDGSYPQTIDWPVCAKPTCTLSNTSDFTAEKNVLNYRDKTNFVCSNATLVTDLGAKIETQCEADGTYDTPLATCRLVAACSEAIPQPPSNSSLQPSSSSVSNEFDTADYECMAGYTLLGTPDADRAEVFADGTFHLTCGNGGTFATPTWPTCQPFCTQHLTPPSAAVSLIPVDTVPNVQPNGATSFKCSDDAYVTDGGKYFEVTCSTNGSFVEPANWPTCRPAVTCSHPPVPPDNTHWELETNLPVMEFSEAKYHCQSPYTFQILPGEDMPEGIDPSSMSLSLTCLGTSHFKVYAEWATQGWPACTQVAETTRKKRWMEFENIQEDIDYTILVLLETQFMYTDQIEQDIYLTTNYSKANVEDFPREMVKQFHRDLDQVLGDGYVKAGLEMKVPLSALCDQPTGADMEKECVPSYLSSGCPEDIITAPWLTSLGFTHKIQHPKWTNTSSDDFGSYDQPVGSSIQFYCNDSLKRPRKDEWDDDSEDGVISAFCMHGGSYSVSMNPADWESCKRRCPAEKPTPPPSLTSPLVPYDSPEQQDREHWQDEEISYGCQNTSLVLNGVKGKKSVTYTCTEGGVYDTPTGQPGSEWPVCTEKPIDPLIIEAVELLGHKFDLNLEYRQKLAKGSGGDVEFISLTAGILSYAIPCVSAVLAVIFLVMCCTRANSPIWKIFEPQS